MFTIIHARREYAVKKVGSYKYYYSLGNILSTIKLYHKQEAAYNIFCIPVVNKVITVEKNVRQINNALHAFIVVRFVLQWYMLEFFQISILITAVAL